MQQIYRQQRSCESEFLLCDLKGILYKHVYVIEQSQVVESCTLCPSCVTEWLDTTYISSGSESISTEAPSVKSVNMCNICKQQVCCRHMHTVSRVWIFLFVLLSLLLCMCQQSGTRPTVVTINSAIYSAFFPRPLSVFVKMIVSFVREAEPHPSYGGCEMSAVGNRCVVLSHFMIRIMIVVFLSVDVSTTIFSFLFIFLLLN